MKKSMKFMHSKYVLTHLVRKNIYEVMRKVSKLIATAFENVFKYCKAIGDDNAYECDTVLMTCTCNAWQITSLPCSHAACKLMTVYAQHVL